MSRQQPHSLTNAIRAVWGLVALSGLTALLTVVFRDELVSRWEAGRPDIGTVQPPEFVPVAIVLFIITLSFSYFVQLRTVREMIAMTNQPPPPDAPPGPPPGFPQLSTRAARGGAFMTLLLFTILALMVVKPF